MTTSTWIILISVIQYIYPSLDEATVKRETDLNGLDIHRIEKGRVIHHVIKVDTEQDLLEVLRVVGCHRDPSVPNESISPTDVVVVNDATKPFCPRM